MSARGIRKVREATQAGILVGLAEVSGVRPRQDIDVYLKEDPKGFNLMILALKHLQEASVDPETGLPSTKPEHILSYYELAGIHGFPKRPWNNVNQKSDVLEKEEGYCPHEKITFPPWHRAYLALFEQVLFVTMIDIADSWSNADLKMQYHQSALNFRLPYWDYYRPRAYSKRGFKFPGIVENGFTSYPYDYSAPLVFTTEQLMIRRPDDNKLVSTKNPLFSYTFPKKIPAADWTEKDLDKIVGKAQQYPRDATLRYPLPKGCEDLDSVATFSAVLNNLRMDSNRVAIALMSPSNVSELYKDYEVFAYSKVNLPKPLPGKRYKSVMYVNNKASGSLENLHNMYHLLCGGDARPKSEHLVDEHIGGGGGHMSSVPISAYDPLFWFHHGQVERLFTIWQKVHEGEPTTNWFSGRHNEEACKPLWPFRKQKGERATDMWSSDDLQHARRLGYTYADVIDGDELDVSKRFADLYSWSIWNDRTQETPTPTAPDAMKPIDVRETDFFRFNESMAFQPTANPLPAASLNEPVMTEIFASIKQKQQHRDWYIDVNVTRMAFNGTFTIYFFLGEDAKYESTSSPGQRFLTAGTLTAAHHIFASSTEYCPNCAAHQRGGTVVSSTAAITSLLLDCVYIYEQGQTQTGLASLHPRDVEPFLRKGLTWKIATIDGTIQDAKALSDEKVFQVGISSSYKGLDGKLNYENHWNVVEQIVEDSEVVEQEVTGQIPMLSFHDSQVRASL